MGRPRARHIGDGPGKTLSRPRAICGRFPLSVGARPVRPSPNWSSGRTKGATPIAQDVTHRRPARSLRPHRSTRDRIVAGVAGGLGEQLGVDPVVLRLAFVVLALAGGFGLVLYLVLWLAGTEG